VAQEANPISPEEAAAQANTAPPFEKLEAQEGPEAAESKQGSALEEESKQSEGAEGGQRAEDKDPAAQDKAGPGKQGEAEQTQTELPAEVAAQFPDADFSKTTVIMNSAEAAKKGLDGFAKDGVIHVAPNVADVKKVLRHEATHIVQQAKKEKGEKAGDAAGGGQQAPGAAEKDGAQAAAQGAPGVQAAQGAQQGPAAAEQKQAPQGAAPTAQLEKEANAAEAGASPAALSPAGPAALNKEPEAGEKKSAQGVPKVTLGFGKGGVTLDKVKGTFKTDLLKADWKPKKLAEFTVKYPIPSFPVAAIEVSAGATFTPKANIGAEASYEWKHADRKFTVSGNMKGSISGALKGYVRGGLCLDAVIQKGGVGLEASLTATASASVSRSISFAYSPSKGFEWKLVPFDIDVKADLIAALSLYAYTKGWFADKKKEWTFKQFPIGYLQGVKAVLEVGGSSRTAAGAAFKTIKPGKFGWGAPPQPVESKARTIK
jgi:hypothetical protein